MKKRFSPELYQQTDALGKMFGYYHIINVEGANNFGVSGSKYDVDLWYRNLTDPADMPPNTLEVEVKRTWTSGPKFTYDTINVLHRKTKYFEAGSNLLLVCNDMEHYLILKAETILASPIEVVRNKYVFNMEQFYKVPADQSEIYRIKSKGLTKHTPTCHNCEGSSMIIDKGSVKCENCATTQKFSKFMIS